MSRKSSSAEGGFSRRSLFALAGAALRPARAQDLRRLAPRPAGPRDPALTTFLERLRSIVSRHDHRALLALMAPDFRVEFDAGKGPAAFRAYWKPELPASPVWEILARLLEIGGDLYSEHLFAAPYVFVHFPIDLDLLGHVVATRPDAPLRAAPAAQAPLIGQLDHAIVALRQPLRPPVRHRAAEFLEVDHPEAGRGWVAAADVYSPAAHRMFLEKERSGWRWISLAAATLGEPPDLIRMRKAGVSL